MPPPARAVLAHAQPPQRSASPRSSSARSSRHGSSAPAADDLDVRAQRVGEAEPLGAAEALGVELARDGGAPASDLPVRTRAPRRARSRRSAAADWTMCRSSRGRRSAGSTRRRRAAAAARRRAPRRAAIRRPRRSSRRDSRTPSREPHSRHGDGSTSVTPNARPAQSDAATPRCPSHSASGASAARSRGIRRPAGSDPCRWAPREDYDAGSDTPCRDNAKGPEPEGSGPCRAIRSLSYRRAGSAARELLAQSGERLVVGEGAGRRRSSDENELELEHELDSAGAAASASRALATAALCASQRAWAAAYSCSHFSRWVVEALEPRVGLGVEALGVLVVARARRTR